MSVLPADRLAPRMRLCRPRAHRRSDLARWQASSCSAPHAGSVTQLYVRGLDHAEATPVPATEGALGPFLSPDGAWIGFWVDSEIKKVPTAGGPAATIGAAPQWWE